MAGCTAPAAAALAVAARLGASPGRVGTHGHQLLLDCSRTATRSPTSAPGSRPRRGIRSCMKLSSGGAVDAPGVRRLSRAARHPGRDRGHDGSAHASTESSPRSPPDPPSPIASGQVARSEKCGPVALALLCLREQLPRARSICIGRSCANLRPHVFAPSFCPTETPIPGPSADAQVGPAALARRPAPPPLSPQDPAK